jgi:hypothetical protein
MKVFAVVGTILVVTAIPIFGKRPGGEQGEHYFSQERPEAIVKAQERANKEGIEKRKAYREQKKQQEHQDN